MEWPKRKENCPEFAGFSKALSWEVPGSQRSVRGRITCTSVPDALSLDLEREAEFDLGRSHKPDQVRLCICIFPSPAAREGPLSLISSLSPHYFYSPSSSGFFESVSEAQRAGKPSAVCAGAAGHSGFFMSLQSSHIRTLGHGHESQVGWFLLGNIFPRFSWLPEPCACAHLEQGVEYVYLYVEINTLGFLDGISHFPEYFKVKCNFPGASLGQPPLFGAGTPRRCLGGLCPCSSLVCLVAQDPGADLGFLGKQGRCCEQPGTPELQMQ